MVISAIRLGSQKACMSPKDTSYVPELDGLRGIAIVMVVGFHAGLPGFGIGGYLGVDVFFVLSGYLITSILLRERETGRIDVLGFYFRRTLRLAPALIMLGLALVAIDPLLLHNSGQVRDDLISSVGYIANWTRAFDRGTPMYLGHVWSLSIEEQFYLFWPLLLSAILGAFGRHQAIVVVVVMACASWLWRAVLFTQGGTINRIYNGTDTRLDALFIGCVLAMAFSHHGGVRSRYPTLQTKLAVVGVAAFAAMFAIARYDSPFMYVAGFAIAGLSTATVILACVSDQDNLLKKAMRIQPLVYIGRISYSLYLWHYPIFLIVWIKWGQTNQALVWSTIPLVAVLAMASYHFVEQPCLRWRSEVRGHNLHIAGAIVLIISETV